MDTGDSVVGSAHACGHRIQALLAGTGLGRAWPLRALQQQLLQAVDGIALRRIPARNIAADAAGDGCAHQCGGSGLAQCRRAVEQWIGRVIGHVVHRVRAPRGERACQRTRRGDGALGAIGPVVDIGAAIAIEKTQRRVTGAVIGAE